MWSDVLSDARVEAITAACRAQGILGAAAIRAVINAEARRERERKGVKAA